MPKSRFSIKKVLNILRQKSEGMSVKEICLQLKISRATYYGWLRTFAFRQMEKENKQLRKDVKKLRPKDKKQLVLLTHSEINSEPKDPEKELLDEVVNIIDSILQDEEKIANLISQINNNEKSQQSGIK